MDGLGEVCPMCFDAFKDPVMLSCGHKLCMECIQSLTHIRIVGHENYVSANSVLTIDSSKYGIRCPYRCSTSSLKDSRRPSLDYLAMYSPEISLKSFIICFLIDGSERYMEMTIRAVNSLMMSTPFVFVGILVPPMYDTSDLYSRVVDPTRLMFKEFRIHFNKWNPTQHKLDIAQFAEEFKIVFWLDSDTYVYKDLTPLLMDFRYSNAKFAFLADHVCTNPEFLGNWKNKSSPFIPQACFMGFRREYIHPFFALWEELWRTWIEPSPFHYYPDPLPSFPGSAFCTEQYALGMAIEKFGLARDDIFELRRVCIPLGFEEMLAKNTKTPLSPTKKNKQLGISDLSLELAPPTIDLKQTFLEHILTSYRFNNSNSSVGALIDFSMSSNSSSSYRMGAFWVDDIEGHIIHFYSLYYEITYAWFTNHRETIIGQTEEYWNPKLVPPLRL